MTPYLYTIIAYFALMLLAKIAYVFIGKERKPIRLHWNFNLVQLKESVMSYLF